MIKGSFQIVHPMALLLSSKYWDLRYLGPMEEDG